MSPSLTTAAAGRPRTAGSTVIAPTTSGAVGGHRGNTTAPVARDASRPALPDADEAVTALALLPDATLLATVCTLTARSNATLAALLAHLGEVGARGLHRERACSSLYTYCVYELRMSEDAAFRRARAAELVRRFPATFTAIARGELHLTGLLQLGPHLTDANVDDLLARARYRTRREIAALVAEIAPRPDAPAVLEPLGPEPARGARAPTHAEFTASLMGPVRTLPAGHAPADWLATALALPAEGEASPPDVTSPVGAGEADGAVDDRAPDPGHAEARPHERGPAEAPTDAGTNVGARPSGDGRTASEVQGANASSAPTPALRYRLQFTVSEAYVELLREVQALASHAVAPGDLAAVHLRALETLAVTLRQRRHASRTPARRAVRQVAEAGDWRSEGSEERASGLVRRGAGTTRSASQRPRPTADTSDGGGAGGATGDRPSQADLPRQRGDETAADADRRPRGDDTSLHADPRRRGDETSVSTDRRPRGDDTSLHADPRRRGDAGAAPAADASSAAAASRPASAAGRTRHVAAAVRRAVWHRDGSRCTHVDDRGRRCAEIRWLELHHLHAFARGGATTAENLTLRCRAHNALASEVDFGRERARRRWRRSPARAPALHGE